MTNDDRKFCLNTVFFDPSTFNHGLVDYYHKMVELHVTDPDENRNTFVLWRWYKEKGAYSAVDINSKTGEFVSGSEEDQEEFDTFLWGQVLKVYRRIRNMPIPKHLVQSGEINAN